MTEAKGKQTPYVDGTSLHPANKTDKPAAILTKNFQQILGEVRYIADAKHPNIYYQTNRFASAATDPTQRHWMRLKCLIRYIQATKILGI